MAELALTDRFVAQCAPVISSNFDTVGTLTRASIDYLKLSEIQAIYQTGGAYHDMDAWFKHSIEMKATGMQRYSLYDWIMANSDKTSMKMGLNVVKAIKSDSMLQPFIFGRSSTVINNDYWKLTHSTGGSNVTLNSTPADISDPLTTITAVNPNAIKKDDGTAFVAADTVLLRIQNRHGIPLDANWFRQRDSLYVFSTAGDGTSQLGMWRVLTAAVVTATDAAKFIDVIAVSSNFDGGAVTYPSGGTTTEPFMTPGALSAGNMVATTGAIVPGVNNVDDYEKWCQNLPNIDTRKRVPFWIQTFRDVRRVDDQYLMMYARLFDKNPMFREFGDLPMAERNAQDERNAQVRFVNSFFFNKPISDNQNLESWELLESILTVEGDNLTLGLSGKLVAKRANFVGQKEQLRVCDRVFDLAGQKLDFYEFMDLNYDICRHRRSMGRKVTDIDWFCNSEMRAHMASAFMDYYQAEWGSAVQITIVANQINTMDMVFDSYRVKRPGGVNINILTDLYFDDFYDEMLNISQGPRGNLLLCLDLGKPGPNGGTMYWSNITSARTSHRTADLDQLAKVDKTFFCVMKHISETVTMKSETGTAVNENPFASAWVEGIKMAKPNLVKGAAPLDLKGGA